MKKLIFIFCLFLFSCKKENYDVEFIKFGFCDIQNGKSLKFIVEETISVESYTIEGSLSLSSLKELGDIKRTENNGLKTYEFKLYGKRPIIYRVRVNHKNGKVQYSHEFTE